jgi:hypothetical protein
MTLRLQPVKSEVRQIHHFGEDRFAHDADAAEVDARRPPASSSCRLPPSVGVLFFSVSRVPSPSPHDWRSVRTPPSLRAGGRLRGAEALITCGHANASLRAWSGRCMRMNLEASLGKKNII